MGKVTGRGKEGFSTLMEQVCLLSGFRTSLETGTLLTATSAKLGNCTKKGKKRGGNLLYRLLDNARLLSFPLPFYA